MSTRQSTVDAILLALPGGTARKMFGEYCVYFDGRPIGLVCNDEFFLKPTDLGRLEMGEPEQGAPYPGAKPHLIVPPAWWAGGEDFERLARLTLDSLPPPKPKKRRG